MKLENLNLSITTRLMSPTVIVFSYIKGIQYPLCTSRKVSPLRENSQWIKIVEILHEIRRFYHLVEVWELSCSDGHVNI